jgi:cyclopropane-fatty-acyl-phospholipid synthase
MDRILRFALSRFVRRGSLTLVTARGTQLIFGDGTAPKVTMRFADRAAERLFLWDPELKLGELFMDGGIVLDEGSIYELFQLVMQDTGGDRSKLPVQLNRRLRSILRWLRTENRLGEAKQNVAHHYDLDERLYGLFLDADRQYSCAYFEHPDQSLEDAQLAKKRHIAAKLLIEPGHNVLDIGSGWGGLALYLAEIAGAGSVKGVTLSEEQLAASRRRAAERGLSRVVSFELEDYRAVQGRFDRIVSVGMFEHVGPKFYDVYFQAVARLLADRGVTLLHTIGRTGTPDYTNPWITKYIFPGGHLPTLSEIMPPVERAGLAVTDIEVLRLHYADTLRAWRKRFLARREEATQLYDERFCRMWECYLSMAEASFRFEDVVVFQLQLAKRNDVVPLTRDYVAEREAALRAAERAPVRITTQAGE